MKAAAKYLAVAIMTFGLSFSLTTLAQGVHYDRQPNDLSGGAMATGAYSGSCADNSVTHDNIGARGCNYITDTAPANTSFFGKSAYGQATVNTTGGNTNICGGLGKRKAVFSAATSDPGETFTVTIDGTLFTFTDNTDFTSVGTDGALASAIGALVDAKIGVKATVVSDAVYIERDENETGGCTVTLGGTNGATITTGTDGVLAIPPGAAATPSLVFSNHATTGIYSRTAQAFDVAINGINKLDITSNLFTIGDTHAFSWSGRSSIRSGSDGNLQLANQANSDFGLLQFGGSTSSFPAWKRSTTTIQARVADDSGGANVDLAGTGSTKGQSFLITSSSQSLTADGSATEVTSGLIPDGAILLGLTTRVTTALSGGGVTGYNVGDGTDADMYGAISATAQNTTSSNADWTADGSGVKLAAGEVTLTWLTGAATAGVVRVTAHYITVGAPTSN